MARILFLATHPKEVASTRYRVLAYEEPLRERGHEVVFQPFFPSASLPDLYSGGGWRRKAAWFLEGARRRWEALAEDGYDLIFIHRELFPLGVRPAMALLERRLRRLKGSLLFDFDDAVFLPHRRERGLIGRLENPASVGRLISLCHQVIAGNSFLAGYAGRYNARVRCIPTPVDTRRYFPDPEPRRDGPLTIGWIGSPSTAKYLWGLSPVFRRLASERSFRLKVIGAGRIQPVPGVETDCRPWDLLTEAEEFRRCDIGVYPLWDDEWSKGKCGYKALQFMASGVPVVTSDVGMNREIIRHGETGLLARSPEDWRDQILELLDSPARRRQLAVAGRREIEERYSLKVVTPQLIETVESAVGKAGGERPRAAAGLAGDARSEAGLARSPGKLSGADILCFSSIDWDFVWQGHQEIMTTLARAGHRVLFVENTGVRGPRLQDVPRIQHRIGKWRRSVRGFSCVEKNLYVFSPVVLPFPYSRLARRINRGFLLSALRRWMQVMDFQSPVCWTFLPTPLTLDLIRGIPHSVLVYYCIDSFVDSTPAAKRIAASEASLLRQADLVFATSRQLQEYCGRTARQVHLFPFGVSLSHFERVREGNPPRPSELEGLKGPIIGYVGGIHQWVDQDLMCEVARSRPEYSFVFVGPLQAPVEKLRRERNIHLIGQRPHGEIPGYIRWFDAGIIPYRLTEYTRNVYPTKLNEYLAMGKPVVSTALPEVESFNRRYDGLVEIGEDPSRFGEAIERALRMDAAALRKSRAAAARDNAWSDRIDAMQQLIQEAIAQKAEERSRDWPRRLRAGIRPSRWTLVLAAAALLGMTLLGTPLSWRLAGPLKVEQPPREADAIVVFAGGVGESGRAGEGYQERLNKGVELYRRGYAPRILLVTGHGWTLKEADVMTAVARGWGVPPEALLAETRVGSTRDYVARVAQAARDNGWERAILVTSPYHGRRAQLTFARNAPWLEVIHAPASLSHYYAPEGGMRLYQLRGILHEYLAILYYWLKGWI